MPSVHFLHRGRPIQPRQGPRGPGDSCGSLFFNRIKRSIPWGGPASAQGLAEAAGGDLLEAPSQAAVTAAQAWSRVLPGALLGLHHLTDPSCPPTLQTWVLGWLAVHCCVPSAPRTGQMLRDTTLNHGEAEARRATSSRPPGPPTISW